VRNRRLLRRTRSTVIATGKASRTELSPRERVAASSRIVVKIGTNVLMRDDGGVSIAAFYGIAESLANARRAGREVLLVSSGAVGLGMQRLELSSRPSELALVQACAAVGQSRLMSMYDDAFDKLGFRVAQVLLTEDDFIDARRHENLRATLTTLLHLGVIPVINENDTVSTTELDRIRIFGDNDKLSALVMTHIDADLLVLLSDVDGLYTGDPRRHRPRLRSRRQWARPRRHGNQARGRAHRQRRRSPRNHRQRPHARRARRHSRRQARRNPFLSRKTPVSEAVRALAQSAKQAARCIASSTVEQRDQALEEIARSLERGAPEILAASAQDLAEAEAALSRGELSKALVDRLKLSPQKLQSMIEGIRAVIALPDPIGRLLDRTELDTGLELEKVSCPLGLLAVIFEARPEAVTQIASLAIKSANAVILKPGSEVERTARVIVDCIRAALRARALPEALVTNIQQRAEVRELLKLDDLIDLVIPRGSYDLVRFVQSNTRIPVLGHSEGVCHIYVDTAADFDMAVNIIDDAKTDYPAACNAVETVLVDQTIAGRFLPLLAARMKEKGVRLRGCPRAIAAIHNIPVEPVAENEWHTEYGDLILALKVVHGVSEAIDHIQRFGSAHTDAIVTNDPSTARSFLQQVASAGVYHNASTRFADGFRYGLGAEVGISTSRLHARGPVGLEGLTTYKYILRGHGQLARDYQGPHARPFLHRHLGGEASANEGSVETKNRRNSRSRTARE
jgi:gamma-glutamyl phosphate reductase